jgi:Holliday junction resolvasome RuvABC endonuclease subunit
MARKSKDIIMFTIDSSTKRTGITVWKNAVFQEFIYINLDPDDKVNKKRDDYDLLRVCETRYPLMCDQIINLLQKYNPQIIWIEDEVVDRNMKTSRYLFRLQGVIEGWALSHDCEFNTIRPPEYRAACDIKGKRKECKAQAVEYVKKKLGIEVTDDEAESYCIGVYVLSLFNISSETSCIRKGKTKNDKHTRK